MLARPRIASLCPSNTEILCALGLADCLVGVDLYSDYPEDVVRRLPRLGPDLNIEIDKLTALQPDLTVCSLSVPGMERVVAQVQQAGLNHIVLSPQGFSDIFADMKRVGDALDGYLPVNHVDQVIHGLRQRVDRIANATRDVSERPRLYWEWWPQPVFSPARDNWLTEVSRLAGAENIFSTDPGAQVRDDGSRVIDANPDYFLAVWTGVPQHKVPLPKILARKGWENIKAFQQQNVFVLSEGLFCRPSPRLVDGLEQLAGLLHPQLVDALPLQSPPTYAPIRAASGRWL